MCNFNACTGRPACAAACAQAFLSSSSPLPSQEHPADCKHRWICHSSVGQLGKYEHGKTESRRVEVQGPWRLAHLCFGGCKIWLQDAGPSQIEAISGHLHGEGKMLVIPKHPLVILEQPICQRLQRYLPTERQATASLTGRGLPVDKMLPGRCHHAGIRRFRPWSDHHRHL